MSPGLACLLLILAYILNKVTVREAEHQQGLEGFWQLELSDKSQGLTLMSSCDDAFLPDILNKESWWHPSRTLSALASSCSAVVDRISTCFRSLSL